MEHAKNETPVVETEETTTDVVETPTPVYSAEDQAKLDKMAEAEKKAQQKIADFKAKLVADKKKADDKKADSDKKAQEKADAKLARFTTTLLKASEKAPEGVIVQYVIPAIEASEGVEGVEAKTITVVAPVVTTEA